MPCVMFDTKASQPDTAALTQALGDAMPHWNTVVDFLATRPEGLTIDWKFYGSKHGWQLKATRKKRAVAYLIPGQDHFRLGAALNAAAVEALGDSGLPPALIAEIQESAAYPEGKPARVTVSSAEDADTALQVLAFKLQH